MDLTTFLLGAGSALAALRGMRMVRDYKAAPAGLSDLVDWDSFVEGAEDPEGTEDHILRLYSGGLVAFYRFKGRNLAMASADERRKTAEEIGEALRPLGTGWMLHIDIVRAYEPLERTEARFSSPPAALIEEERIETFNDHRPLLKTSYVLALTFAPDPKGGGGARAFRPVLSSLGREKEEAPDGQALLAQFRREISYLEDRLSSVLGLAPMQKEEVLRHLHFCLTGLSHRVRPPGANIALGDYLADQPLFGGLAPRIGRRHLRVISPHALHGHSLTPLMRLPFPLRWSTRFIPLSDEDARRRIRNKRHQWIKRRKDLMSTLKSLFGGGEETPAQKAEEEEFFENKTARRFAGEAGEALAVLDDGRGRYGLFSSAVILTDPDEARLAEHVRQVRSVFRACGFPARTEELGAVGAYHGSLPGNGYANPRRFLLHTGNLGELFPAHHSFAGHARNPSSYFPEKSPPVLVAKGTGGGRYRLHLHALGDVGHTLLVGATGAGKSVLVNTLLAQWDRYKDAQSFLFDVGHSGLPLAEATGAAHYELHAHAAKAAAGPRGEGRPQETRGNGLRPQPLRHLAESGEQAWAASWLELYFELQGLSLGPGQRRRLQAALRLVGQHLAPDERTLSVLREQIQDRALREALAPITGAGAYAHLFDGRASDGGGDAAARQVFELSRVRQLSSKIFTSLLAYLFHRVERQLAADRPSLIVLEEAWSALKEPAFAERVQEWFLTLRKKNASVVLVAHTLSQLEELGPLREVIVDSCQTKIYLPNPAALKPENARLYQNLGLNAQEVSVLAHARRKRDYFVKTPAGAALIDLCAGPLTLQTLTLPSEMSVPRYRERVAALRAEHGDTWFAHYLHQRGLGRWAERYAQAQPKASQPASQTNGEADALPVRSSLH